MDANTEKKIQEMLGKGIEVKLPDHLYIPAQAQTLDFREIADVGPGSIGPLIDFTCPKGVQVRILAYAIFNDGLGEADYDFTPTVDGGRVYPYQGSSLFRVGNVPSGSPRIYLGVSTDLSDSALIPGLLDLQPGQRLIWTAENRSAVAATMGVRVTGYVSRGNKLKNITYGG